MSSCLKLRADGSCNPDSPTGRRLFRAATGRCRPRRPRGEPRSGCFSSACGRRTQRALSTEGWHLKPNDSRNVNFGGRGDGDPCVAPPGCQNKWELNENVFTMQFAVRVNRKTAPNGEAYWSTRWLPWSVYYLMEAAWRNRGPVATSGPASVGAHGTSEIRKSRFGFANLWPL